MRRHQVSCVMQERSSRPSSKATFWSSDKPQEKSTTAPARWTLTDVCVELARPRPPKFCDLLPDLDSTFTHILEILSFISQWPKIKYLYTTRTSLCSRLNSTRSTAKSVRSSRLTTSSSSLERGLTSIHAVAKQYISTAPLYAKRQEVISKIENFWPLVFEQSPPDVDRYITPNDANIFAKLKSLDVKRFEIPMGPEKIDAEAGDPRSIVIRFEFDDNDYFTNSVLEKKFWYRRSNDGWSGLVSEPVKIDWKDAKDPTEGLTDAAYAVFEARKKAGNMKKKDFPAHNKLVDMIENWNADNTSFFTWFGFVSATRYISADESAQANKEYKQRQDRRSKGERVESPEPEEEDMADMSGDDEVHPEGDELAQLIAEDVWPNAIKYFSKTPLSISNYGPY